LAEPLERRILLTSVTAVDPPANSLSAHVSTDIAATFDQNINPATATPQNFVVHSMQRGQLAGSSAIVSAAGATVTLDPTSDFLAGELVQASVTSAIQSTGGQGADARVWQLRTAVDGGGSGAFSDSGQSLGNFDSESASLGDVDGDGDLDAYMANYANGNRVWLGIGGNKTPTLDALTNVTHDEDAPQQTVNVEGISAGSGETQPLNVTAASNNTALIPDPTVAYTSPQATGTLSFTAVADASSTAIITVTVEDGGLDGNLSTTADNAKFSRTFDVTVNAVNDLPTLDTISSLTINQGATEQTVNLSGIAAGGGESQPLKVTAVSDNTGLIPNPTATYTSPQSSGTLTFTPVATASGSATVTVTVEDGGLDIDLSTAADNAKFDGTFGVTVNPVAATTVTGLVLNNRSANRSGLASLTLQFSEATTVDAAGSLALWNHTTGAAVDSSGATLGNNGTTAVTWNLAGIALPDGNYTATLPKAAAGLAATHTRPLHVLAGDSSGNAQVDFADFGDLANGFNTAGPSFGPGDMNGDGNIDFTDFGILANNFNNILPALTLDFGDAPESGTSFPTTRANDGARHVLGSGLSLGATVDAETDGQPDANAAGDGADEDGVTFATLTAGSNAAITVPATVPGTAVLNAWIDFNADGDWGDPGEKIFSDQAVTNGTNNLTAAIPAGAAAGQVFARFRITTDAGHTYSGLARDGEVEDYQVALVAAKASSRRLGAFNLQAAAFVAQPTRPQTTSVGPQRHLAEPLWRSVEPVGPKVVNLALGSAQHTPTRVRAGSALLDEQLVDRVFEEEMDLLPLDNGSGGAI